MGKEKFFAQESDEYPYVLRVITDGTYISNIPIYGQNSISFNTTTVKADAKTWSMSAANRLIMDAFKLGIRLEKEKKLHSSV